MSRGVCITRTPVAKVHCGWGGTHLRYLAVKSAVGLVKHSAARFLIDADGVGGGGLQESVHRGMADVRGVPPPQLLLVCDEQLTRTIQGEGIFCLPFLVEMIKNRGLGSS